jgi:hypothetical protein
MAGLDFASYREAFMSRLDSTAQRRGHGARARYPWTRWTSGKFKYLLTDWPVSGVTPFWTRCSGIHRRGTGVCRSLTAKHEIGRPAW